MCEDYMKLVGSGSAEAIPDALCDCIICNNARMKRGREIRTRSCFRINELTQIDFGPDQLYQSIILGNDLRSLDNILITHSHDDHFCFTELGLKEMAVKTNEKPLNVYIGEEGYNWFKEVSKNYFPNDYFDERLFNIVKIQRYKEYTLGDISFVALKGNHKAFGQNEYSNNYLIKLENNKKMYYAVDTGYFLEETFEYLKNEFIDFLVIEGTFGDARTEEKPEGHLGCNGVLSVVERLIKNNTLNGKSKVIITHINHKHNLTHEGLVKFYDNQDLGVEFIVGYDGLEIIK